MDDKDCDPSDGEGKPERTSLLLLSESNQFVPADDLGRKLYPEIQLIARQQLEYAMNEDMTSDGAKWELFVSDGKLKMYKMEREVDGIVVDPLKAIHSVKGITAREYINMFFNPSIKKEWDDTLESVKTLQFLSPHTVLLHQLHKKVWPADQREALFWSQRLCVSEFCCPAPDSTVVPLVLDKWMVCNHDMDAVDVPLHNKSNIRVKLTIAMVCQTILDNKDKMDFPRNELSRDDLSCKIIYVAEVHPGGWIPKLALRQIYKREYPKFLRDFTNYVLDKVNNADPPKF